jgi:hypothetical protein
MLLTDVLPSDRDFIEFCECDSNWGPLLFLRPAADERMSVRHTAFGAILLGVPFGLFATIILTLYAHFIGKPAPALFQYPLLLSLGYWLTAQLTLARAWNRRVKRRGR